MARETVWTRSKIRMLYEMRFKQGLSWQKVSNAVGLPKPTCANMGWRITMMTDEQIHALISEDLELQDAPLPPTHPSAKVNVEARRRTPLSTKPPRRTDHSNPRADSGSGIPDTLPTRMLSVKYNGEEYTKPHSANGAPLPAGHPYTWGLLTKGTILEGVPFRRH